MSYRRNQVRCSDRMCGATDCPACYPDSAFGVEICAKCGDGSDHRLCRDCRTGGNNMELVLTTLVYWDKILRELTTHGETE